MPNEPPSRADIEHARDLFEEVWQSPRLREAVAASLDSVADVLEVLRWVLGDTSDPKFEECLRAFEARLFFAKWNLEEADQVRAQMDKEMADPEDPEE